MTFNSYLYFDGNCQAAFRFYERCLGGQLVRMLTHKDSPMADKAPAELRDRVMHARLVVGDAVLMGSDGMPGQHDVPKGFSVNIGVDTPAEADRIFSALSQNGTVNMPIQETFWALRFGMLVDRYGIPWMVNCDRPGD